MTYPAPQPYSPLPVDPSFLLWLKAQQSSPEQKGGAPTAPALGGGTGGGILGNLLKNGSSNPIVPSTPYPSVFNTESTSGITGAELPGGLGLDTPVPTPVEGAGSSFLPAAGVAAGAYTGAQQLGGVRNALKGGKLSGQQQLALALPTFGGSLAYNELSSLWDKNKFQTEGKRLGNLQKQGYDVSQSDGMGLKKGRSKKDLVGIEQAKIDAGQYGNTKFAESRNLADATGQDFQGYASIVEHAGKNATLADRIALAQKVLDARAGNEHNGTFDVDWSKLDQPQIPVVDPNATVRKLPAMIRPGTQAMIPVRR